MICHRSARAEYQVHGFPFVACSIGLAFKGEPVIGVIHAPFLHQTVSPSAHHLFTRTLISVFRRQGQGSFPEPNDQTTHHWQAQATSISWSSFVRDIHVRPAPWTDGTRIGAEYGSSREAPALPAKIKTFEKLAAHTNAGGKMVHSLRSMGSAALNICQVATGGLDLYWEIGVSCLRAT